MKRNDRAFDRELEALLERGRVIPPLPDVVRARAIARARATTAKGIPAEPTPTVAMPTHGHGRRVAWAAAAFALMIAGAGAVAAIRTGVLERIYPAPPLDPPAGSVARAASPPPLVPPAAAVEPDPIPTTTERRWPRRLPTESYAAELHLLHRAQVAYASRDFSSALVLVADHARRFPNGRLAEEREALRVRSLASSGRRDDARRAATAFAARFPRSVLLPRLQEAAGRTE